MNPWQRPRTMYGFPIEDQEGERVAKSGRRGVALIIAIMAVAIIMIFSSNMIVTSSVILELAVAQRDNVKAEYLAKSGQNLAAFIIVADWAIDLAMYQQTKKEPTDAADDIWSQLNGLPIGGETLEMLAATQKKFDLSQVSDGKVIETLQLFDGQFTIEIEDELSRINLSNCGKDKCTETVTMLTALMSCPSEKLFLEKKDLRPAAMAFRIKDWIDDNRTAEAESGFSNEDDPYEKKFPPYKAKNGPMDSLQELMLIEGWDEEMHLTFSPYLTIYPYLRGPTNTAKVNINTVKKELLACLVPSAKVECADKFFQMLIKQDKEGGARVSGANELQQFLSSDLCDSVSSEQTAKSAWFSYRTKFFRVKSQGQAGLQSRDLETVVERMIPDKAKKIETSYQFLYWKLL